jgi:hypothetical protein
MKVSGNQGVHQGKMVGFKVVASDALNAITFTLSIKDKDGDVIYTSGAQARNGVRVVMGLDIPLVEQEVVSIDPSADPGDTLLTTDDFVCSNITLYYHPDVLERAR